MYLARHLAAAGSLALVAMAASLPTDAGAQQIFKIVGPDGRITFSDRQPADPAVKATPATVVGMESSGGTPTASLPFEVRQAASRYPVTIYTAPGCTTCARGRALLQSRGVPFSEKTVSSKEDIEALTRLTGASTVPVLTIGSQQLRGVSDAEWTQFLDAAGYPKTSQLPPSYVPAPATPLVAFEQQRPAEAAPSRPEPPQQQRNQQAEQRPENPAGIQF